MAHSTELANHLQVLTDRGFEFHTLYDVGASIGNWSLSAQACLPAAQIEMFEPLAGRFAEIDKRAKHGEVVNGTLHNIALSNETGETEIKILGGCGAGSSILVLESDRRKNIEIIRCPIWKLDEYIDKHDLPQPDFIKIDAQAGELKILEGARNTLKNCTFLLLEVWARRVYGPETPLFQELAHFLDGQNFVMYDMFIEDHGRDADGTLRYFDALFINRTRSPFPSSML